MSQDNIPIIVKVSDDDASNHVKAWFTQDEGPASWLFQLND